MGDDPGDETPDGVPEGGEPHGHADGQADGFRERADFAAPLDGDEWKGSGNPVNRPILPPAVPPEAPYATPPRGVEPGDSLVSLPPAPQAKRPAELDDLSRTRVLGRHGTYARGTNLQAIRLHEEILDDLTAYARTLRWS